MMRSLRHGWVSTNAHDHPRAREPQISHTNDSASSNAIRSITKLITMPQPVEKSSPQIEVIFATQDQQPILANLIELYAHDFSEVVDLEIGKDGRFGYPSLPLYWSEPSRHPFLIRVDGQLAGFALVKHGSELSGNRAVWDMAEFFILRGYRKRGIGIHAAHQVWKRFPGPWEVRVMQANVSALHFWTKAIAEFTGQPAAPDSIDHNGKCCSLFSFESKGA
jgi:predicted acetyltransferase